MSDSDSTFRIVVLVGVVAIVAILLATSPGLQLFQGNSHGMAIGPNSVITSVNPSTVTQGGTVTISGTDFDQNSRVNSEEGVWIPTTGGYAMTPTAVAPDGSSLTLTLPSAYVPRTYHLHVYDGVSYNTAQGTAVVTVTGIPPASVTVSPVTASINVGLSQQLTAVVKDQNGAVITTWPVSWSTSNPSIATVTTGGSVIGVSQGTATITATSGGKIATATVTIVPIPSVTSVSPATVLQGGTITIKGTGFDQNSRVNSEENIWLPTGGYAMTPTAVAPDGTSITLTLPQAYTPRTYHLHVFDGVAYTTAQGTAIVTVATPLTSACGSFSNAGKYILNSDIALSIDGRTDCYTFHDTSNVDVDCQNHTIDVDITDTGGVSSTFAFSKVNTFSLKNCVVRLVNPNNQLRNVLTIDHSTNGVISLNTFKKTFANGNPITSINGSSGITFSDNNGDGTVYNTYSNNNLIQNNTLSTSNIKGVTTIIAALIGSVSGGNNKILNNKLNGIGAGTGLDDGINLYNENNDLVQGNSISTVWDCGIETSGFVTNTIVDSNTISHAALCGVGGWFGMSMQNNTISNNRVDQSSEIFVFIRKWDLQPGETTVYFKNNNFVNNKITNGPIQSTAIPLFNFYFAEASTPPIPPQSAFVGGNNHFLNNDFGSSTGPRVFRPGNIYIDDGGNICHVGNTTINCLYNNYVDESVVPATPTGLTATSGACGTASINLTWNPSANAAKYNIIRSFTLSGVYGSPSGSMGITSTSFNDIIGSPGLTIYYKVEAQNAAGISPDSAPVSAVTSSACPS